MQTDTNIRLILDDIPALKAVIDANNLFPSDMLDSMISNYFEDDN